MGAFRSSRDRDRQTSTERITVQGVILLDMTPTQHCHSSPLALAVADKQLLPTCHSAHTTTPELRPQLRHVLNAFSQLELIPPKARMDFIVNE